MLIDNVNPFPEREYRCLGEWREDGLIYTYTERRDMIGYECFVGLVTAKGDIYLREAGSNCERGQEPLKYGMRLTQVSKCYGSHHPRLRWRTSSTTSRPRKRITALPSWRQRELNNLIPGSSRAPASLKHSSLIWNILAVTVVLTWFSCEWVSECSVNRLLFLQCCESPQGMSLPINWYQS